MFSLVNIEKKKKNNYRSYTETGNNVNINNCFPLAFYKKIDYKLPLASCSLSIASNKALKLPFPKLFAPLR